MALTFYTISESLDWLREQRGWDYTDEGFRKLIKTAGLPLHRIGKLTLVPEEYLFQLAQRPQKPARGPKKRIP